MISRGGHATERHGGRGKAKGIQVLSRKLVSGGCQLLTVRVQAGMMGEQKTG